MGWRLLRLQGGNIEIEVGLRVKNTALFYIVTNFSIKSISPQISTLLKYLEQISKINKLIQFHPFLM
jgi:uncharacterized protein YpmS